jgi:DNA polymerase-3 subunit gamma/tau
MIRSARRTLGLRLGLVGLAAAAAVFFPVGQAQAQAPEKAAAAIDAQCAWGRLADGHGHLVRCLTSEEAVRLKEPPPAVAPPPLSATVAAEPMNAAPAAAAPSAASTAATAIWPLPPPRPPAEAPPTPAPAPAPAVEELSVEIGQVVADSGTLSDSQKALRKARDRMTECAEKNGGLTADRAEVELRFLVQERGRAEGVSLKKRRGLGEAAAKCLADVVDRRFVGFPDQPAVGATLVVTISKKKK